MGGSYSYIKMKVNDHTACFVYGIPYTFSTTYCQRTISCHENKFNKYKLCDWNYYKTYSGDEYYFDGDFQRLDNILKDFDPKTESIEFLKNRLETECDLQKYKKIWERINEWATFILNIPGSAIGIIFNNVKRIAFCPGDTN